MAQTKDDHVSEMRERARAYLRRHWQASLLEGLILTLLGILALAAPRVATLGFDYVLGGILVLGGLMQVARLFITSGQPGFWSSGAVALLYVVAGSLLIANPAQGILTLTLIVGTLFLASGIGQFLLALDLRGIMSWGWAILSGTVSLAIAVLLFVRWPGDAPWAIGLLVGVNMVVFGVSLMLAALAARRA